MTEYCIECGEEIQDCQCDNIDLGADEDDV